MAALWVASHHPDWSGSVLSFLESRLRSPEFPAGEAEPLREVLLSFCSSADIQKLVGNLLGDAAGGAKRALFLLDTIDHCELKEFPTPWMERIAACWIIPLRRCACAR
jgi:hypothetical protein